MRLYQKERLAEIDKYIARQRQALEDYYQKRITLIQTLAAGKTRFLEEAETLAIPDNSQSRTIFQDIVENSPPRLARRQSRIDQEKAGLARLDRQIRQLESQKDLSTASLTRLENKLKDDALKPKPKPTHGMVTGIIFSRDKQTALIDRQIVHPQDTIHGVTVVGIRLDKVEFEKNGAKWTQQVRQTPPAYWK